MSQNLCWRPVKAGRCIGGSQLRDAIRKRFGDRATLGWDSTTYIEGLADAGVEGATRLLDIITENDGEIEVWIE